VSPSNLAPALGGFNDLSDADAGNLLEPSDEVLNSDPAVPALILRGAASSTSSPAVSIPTRRKWRCEATTRMDAAK
jgi:hypothetical protein